MARCATIYHRATIKIPIERAAVHYFLDLPVHKVAVGRIQTKVVDLHKLCNLQSLGTAIRIQHEQECPILGSLEHLKLNKNGFDIFCDAMM